jgi:hypothetical protein
MSYFYKKAIQSDGKLSRIKGLELSGKYFHVGDVAAIKATQDALK